MKIHFKCSNCGASYVIDSAYAGKRGKCKKCQAAIIVPENDKNEVEEPIISNKIKKKNLLIRAWNGEAALWEAYWIIGVLIFLLLYVLSLIKKYVIQSNLTNNSTLIIQILLITAILIVYLSWCRIVIICSENPRKTIWSSLAKFIVSISVIVAIGDYYSDFKNILSSNSSEYKNIYESVYNNYNDKATDYLSDTTDVNIKRQELIIKAVSLLPQNEYDEMLYLHNEFRKSGYSGMAQDEILSMQELNKKAISLLSIEEQEILKELLKKLETHMITDY